LVTAARTIFTQQEYQVIGEFGTMFYIQRKQDKQFFVVPVNATAEYFAVLKEQLQ
jgi:hypothetical protein